MAPETKEDIELLKDAAREVEERFAKKKQPGPMFGRPPLPPRGDDFTMKLSPGPKGPPTDQLIEEAKRRRRERAEEERSRRG